MGVEIANPNYILEYYAIFPTPTINKIQIIHPFSKHLKTFWSLYV